MWEGFYEEATSELRSEGQNLARLGVEVGGWKQHSRQRKYPVHKKVQAGERNRGYFCNYKHTVLKTDLLTIQWEVILLIRE